MVTLTRWLSQRQNPDGREGIKTENTTMYKILLYNGARKWGRNWKVMSDQERVVFFFLGYVMEQDN